VVGVVLLLTVKGGPLVCEMQTDLK